MFLQNVVINITNETMPGLLRITNTLIQILFILRQICILFWDNRIERYSKFPTQPLVCYLFHKNVKNASMHIL